MIRHFTNESTSTFLFSLVRKRSASGASRSGCACRRSARSGAPATRSTGPARSAPHHLAELELDRRLALVDRVQAHREHQRSGPRRSTTPGAAPHRPRLPVARAQRLAAARRSSPARRRHVVARARRSSPRQAGRRHPHQLVERQVQQVLPPFWSMITLLVEAMICCIVSRYMRSRVTCGAFCTRPAPGGSARRRPRPWRSRSARSRWPPRSGARRRRAPSAPRRWRTPGPRS